MSNFSAVLPLLVVSVYVSLLATRSFRFYKTQTHRGDVVSGKGGAFRSVTAGPKRHTNVVMHLLLIHGNPSLARFSRFSAVVPENLCEPGKDGNPLCHVSWSNCSTPTGGDATPVTFNRYGTPSLWETKVGKGRRREEPSKGHRNSTYPSGMLDCIGGDKGREDDEAIPFYGSLEGGIIGKVRGGGEERRQARSRQRNS